VQPSFLLILSARLEKVALLVDAKRKKRKRRKRKDYAGSPADALDVTPAVGGDAGGEGGGDGGGP
jgi:hypothetical protein